MKSYGPVFSLTSGMMKHFETLESLQGHNRPEELTKGFKIIAKDYWLLSAITARDSCSCCLKRTSSSLTCWILQVNKKPHLQTRDVMITENHLIINNCLNCESIHEIELIDFIVL